jgi:hypothetical protein
MTQKLSTKMMWLSTKDRCVARRMVMYMVMKGLRMRKTRIERRKKRSQRPRFSRR